MARYQIRTPENIEIEDVIEVLAVKAWGAILDFVDPNLTPISRKNFKSFHDHVRNCLSQHLKAFRLCGLSNICIDATLDAPLASEQKQVGGNPWDLVYHIFVQGNAADFVQKLAEDSIDSVQEFLKPGTREQALHAVTHIFREILADYLFYNPVCGKTELCIYSGSDELSPWERDEHGSHSKAGH